MIFNQKRTKRDHRSILPLPYSLYAYILSIYLQHFIAVFSSVTCSWRRSSRHKGGKNYVQMAGAHLERTQVRCVLATFLPSHTPSHSHSAFASDCYAMVVSTLCDENGLFLLTKHRIKIIGCLLLYQNMMLLLRIILSLYVLFLHTKRPLALDGYQLMCKLGWNYWQPLG